MAFLKSSRYAKTPVIEVEVAPGKTVTALRLRRLPETAGTTHVVDERDRLDLIAYQALGDGTRFWSVADANNELDAQELIMPRREISVPKP